MHFFLIGNHFKLGFVESMRITWKLEGSLSLSNASNTIEWISHWKSLAFLFLLSVYYIFMHFMWLLMFVILTKVFFFFVWLSARVVNLLCSLHGKEQNWLPTLGLRRWNAYACYSVIEYCGLRFSLLFLSESWGNILCDFVLSFLSNAS